MKKVILFLIAYLGFFGASFAQSYESHWSNFNPDIYEQPGVIIANVKIDNNLVSGTDNWSVIEIGAFVNDTVRGHAFMVYEPQFGDPYPILQLLIYFNVDKVGDVVTFKLYDHNNGKEYDYCISSVSIYSGQDIINYDNPIVLSFFTTFTKDISACSEEGGFYLIASPIGEVSPEDVINMVSNDYDLYYFDQTGDAEGKEWINYKDNNYGNFNLTTGKGFLYANSEDVRLVFVGLPYSSEGLVDLDYDSYADYPGWNLVGNPFSETAYSSKPYYRLNSAGSGVDSNLVDPTLEENAINPMEGVFVIAEGEGETMTFTPADNAKSIPNLALNLSSNSSLIDRAIVRFDEGGMLPKFQFLGNSTKVYIPMNGTDYAVVRSNKSGRVPVNFEPTEEGTYNISVNTKEVEVKYLHLIDYKENIDIDLLSVPTYSFEAKTDDKSGRFELVFSMGSNLYNDPSSDADEDFGFFSNGNWIISNEGEATLQVVDINGRILKNEQIEGSYCLSFNPTPGIYMMRLINGDNVKVQKVVVK